jgi:hypothetical protein
VLLHVPGRAELCPPRKAAEINPVVNAKNLAARFRTTRREQITAKIGFGADKFCAGAEFAQQFVIAEIAHEILTMRRHAERNSADCFHEHGGVRGAIGKMDMKMAHPRTLEKLDKKKRVPRTQRRLVFGAVFFFMLRDQRARPATFAVSPFGPAHRARVTTAHSELARAVFSDIHGAALSWADKASRG